MELIFCLLIGYVVGVINPSYLIGRIKGFDIRSKGSKNAGASNALILFGKTVGILCAIFDIAKAALAVLIAKSLFDDFSYAFATAGTACVIGHMFPFYMKFKGGKGLACLGGLILAFDLRVFLIMLAIEIVIVLVTDYICFVPMSASIAFPIIYGVMERDLISALILSLVTVVILLKHIQNIVRIINGSEMHFSFLWNKDKEFDRMREAAEK